MRCDNVAEPVITCMKCGQTPMGRSKVSYSKRRTSWPFSVIESPNRSYIPRLVIVGLEEGRGGSSRCDFWSRGQSAGVSQISHTTTSTPDAAIASPDMGGYPPWRLHRVWAPGSDVARAGYDPQGCKSGQKQRSQSCLEVSELPRSLRSARRCFSPPWAA